MAHNLQKFLRENSITDLEKGYGVYCKQHPLYPNLHQFTYDQIESDRVKSDPIVRESRGIILDRDNDWAVVAFSFLRFFNVGEGCQDTIDWASSKIQDKVDGSLCQVYYYDGKWHIATKGTPDAGGNVNGYPMNFRQLFWKVADSQGVTEYLNTLGDKNVTYVFELTTIYNKVVVRYPEPKLTLLAVRHKERGEAHVTDYVSQKQEAIGTAIRDILNPVREFHFASQEEMVEFARKINGTEGEGFVVVDKDFHRIKVKSDNYLALSHMKDGFGPRRALEIVRKAEVGEVQTYIDNFPEMQPLFDEAQRRYGALVSEVKAQYEEIRDIPEQKEFALKAVKTRLSGALFKLRKDGTSIEKYIADMNIKNLIELLGMRDEEIMQAA
jgi:hypothetical protein